MGYASFVTTRHQLQAGLGGSRSIVRIQKAIKLRHGSPVQLVDPDDLVGRVVQGNPAAGVPGARGPFDPRGFQRLGPVGLRSTVGKGAGSERDRLAISVQARSGPVDCR
jgi:hypothetical protein